jgi:hypothetical protein
VGSADGGAEPLGQLAEQIMLVFTYPCHRAVRPQQRRGHDLSRADVDDVVEPVRPARHRKPAGLVEQQSASAVHQLVKAAPLQRHVPHPPAEQGMPVADARPGAPPRS